MKSHFVGAGKPAISLAHLDIDKPAPTNQLIITIPYLRERWVLPIDWQLAFAIRCQRHGQ